MNKPKPILDKKHALEPKKICTKCGGDPKPLSEFYRKKTSKDGHVSVCMVCKREINRKSYNKVKPKPPKREEEREKNQSKEPPQTTAVYRSMKNIRDRVRSTGVSMDKLEELTDIGKGTLMGWIHSKQRPQDKRFKRLLDVLYRNG